MPIFTFLFTDIDSSTGYWERDPAAMRASLELHDGAVWAAIEGAGGDVYKHTGDGMCACFEDPTSAVGAALAVQRDLAAVDWPPTCPLTVRIGVHTGQADRRGADFAGVALNRTARVTEAAHGGQVIATEATMAGVDRARLPGIDQVDLGVQRLRGVLEPIRLFRIDAEDAPADPRPLPAREVVPRGPPSPRLLEREAELGALEQAFSAAVDGRGSVALVFGEAGIGKTSLVRGFVGSVDERARVLLGVCDDLLTPRVLGPFHDMARQRGRRLVDIVASEPSADKLLGVLLEDIRARAAPILLVVEDLHWADDASVDVLRLLSRRMEDLPALLVLTYRDDDIAEGHPLPELLGSLTGPNVVRLPLGPLSPAAVAALADDAGATSSDDIFATTGGNPFFVSEVLAAGSGDVPVTVRDAVASRIAQLPSDTQAALQLLSLVPTGPETSLAAEVLGSDIDCLAAAERRGVLLLSDGRIQFRHEVARRAVQEATPASRQVLHHRRIMAGLERIGAEPSRIVHHAVEAGAADEIDRYSLLAAREASAAGAHRQAAEHYGRLLANPSRLERRDLVALLADQAEELRHLARYREAAASAERAASLWEQGDPNTVLGRAMASLARIRQVLGEGDASLAAAKRAVEVYERDGPGSDLAWAYAHLASTYRMMMLPEPAVEWAKQAIELAEQLGEKAALANSLDTLGTSTVLAGDPSGEAHVRRAFELAQSIGETEQIAVTCNNMAVSLFNRARIPEMGRYLDVGLAAARDGEHLGLVANMTNLRCWLDWFLGDWVRAEAGLRDLMARQIGHGIIAGSTLAVLGRLLARRGDAEADSLLERAWASQLPTGNIQRVGQVAVGWVEWALLHDQPERAQEYAAPALALAEEAGHAVYRGELLVYLRRAGIDVQSFPGCPEPFAAELAGDWKRAAELWSDMGSGYEQALALAASKRPRQIEQAIAIASDLGAEPAARLLGRRLEAGKRKQRPVTGWESLTQAELKVAELVAQGLTNGEVAAQLHVSPRTVESHLGRAFAKLQVRSRVELAVAAAKRPE